jgi:hypothetical protein
MAVGGLARVCAVTSVRRPLIVGCAQKLPISSVVIRAPRLETSFLIQLVRKVDVGPAIQQIPQIQTHPLKVHGINLEISPIQRSVGVVVVDLARAPRIFSTLNGQGYPARRAEFVAGVLLVGRQVMAGLIGLSFHSVFAGNFCGDNQRPMKEDFHRRLKAECVSVPQDQDREGGSHCHKDHNAGRSGGDRRFGPASPLSTGPLRRSRQWSFGSGAHGVAPLRASLVDAGKPTGNPEKNRRKRITSPDYYRAFARTTAPRGGPAASSCNRGLQDPRLGFRSQCPHFDATSGHATGYTAGIPVVVMPPAMVIINAASLLPRQLFVRNGWTACYNLSN